MNDVVEVLKYAVKFTATGAVLSCATSACIPIPETLIGVTLICVTALVPVPPPLVACKVILYCPTVVNVITGLSFVENGMLLLRHDHDVGVFVDVSVNCTVSGVLPDVVFVEKDATGVTGAAVTVIMVAALVPVPALFVACSVMLKTPAAPKVYDGLCTVENCVPLTSHDHDVGVFVDVSVNCTVRGITPDVRFAVNEAAGAGISA